MTIVVVFSGYNMRAVFALLRRLSTLGVETLVIAASPADPILRSDWRYQVALTRESPSLDPAVLRTLFERLQRTCPDRKFLVAPSTEALNRCLLRHADSVLPAEFTLPLVDGDTYARLSDKKAFHALCSASGLAVPPLIEAPTATDVPLVAKPVQYSTENQSPALKPILIKNAAAWEQFAAVQETGDYFYERFVDGSSYYLLFYFYEDGRPPLRYSQKNFAQQAEGGSILAAKSACLHESPDCDAYVELLNSLSFRGLVMIELRGEPGAFFMIEANPRMWGPSQLFVDAGVGLFDAMLEDYGVIDRAPIRAADESNVAYFWDDGTSFNDEYIDSLAFFDYSAKELRADYPHWDDANLFKRPDTMALYEDMTRRSQPAVAARLRDLYRHSSKHSNYQSLAPQLVELLGESALFASSMYERERFDFIHRHVELDGRTVIDIGANTGYFSIQAASAGARLAVFEGNPEHATFIDEAASAIGLGDRIEVAAEYFRFEANDNARYDVAFLLNVLHHVGDDYGDSQLTIDQARDSMRASLQHLSACCATIVLQLGFNWQGNVDRPLFERGTKREVIDFICECAPGYFEIASVGIATGSKADISYIAADDDNIVRRDDLGEFLNRPLFILRSLTPGN